MKYALCQKESVRRAAIIRLLCDYGLDCRDFPQCVLSCHAMLRAQSAASQHNKDCNNVVASRFPSISPLSTNYAIIHVRSEVRVLSCKET